MKDIILYDVEKVNFFTRNKKMSYKAYDYMITSIAFTGDSRYFATSSTDSIIKLWKVSNGKMVNVFKCRDEVASICFSPDDRYLISSDADENLILWDVDDEEEIETYSLRDMASAVQFSPNGKYIGSGDAEGNLILWEIDIP
jgi:WD40 repeat protein